MEFPSEIIKSLVTRLVTIPGIGQRSAIRIVLNLLKQKKEDVEALSDDIRRLKNDLKYCKKCQSISDHEICFICNDKSRDNKVICIVEDIRDIIAIENTNQYRGLYFVLGALISPVDGVGPGDLNIHVLSERLKKENIHEIIFALNATVEGDTTTFYIAKLLNEYNLKITALSRGISIGGELEYADEITLGRSLINRTAYTI